MKIAIIGTGYVGLTTGVCFAEMGIDVECVDIDVQKIDKLKQGKVAIYEPGLTNLLTKNLKDKRLSFSTEISNAIKSSDVVFIAVGTPEGADGSADLSQVYAVAEAFGNSIEKYTLLVTKSTVPIGTSHKIEQIVSDRLKSRGAEIPFDIASNPEFLKEGAAVKDFMSPDRVIVGVESERARNLMEKIYKPFLLSHYRIIFMDIKSAEMTKYASNAMLATRISFINEIARLCELTGVDIEKVRSGMASDSRIGNKFLYPGCGYGGSCFPKDVKALLKTGEQLGYNMQIIKSVEEVNNNQKRVVYHKLYSAFDENLKDKRVAILGLSFKPETNDMRQAPSITTIEMLLSAGAQVVVYDPIAMEECRTNYFKERVIYSENFYDCVKECDAMAVLTEWKEFRVPNWQRIKQLMRGNVIVDGRDIYSPAEVKALGFRYFGIGR